MAKKVKTNNTLYVIFIFLISFVLLYLVKKLITVKENFDDDFCNSRDLHVWIEIKTKNSSNAGGTLTSIKLKNGSTDVTDNFSIVQTFNKNSTENTGWLRIPVKLGCTVDKVNKIKLSCRDSIHFDWLLIKVRSKHIIRTKTITNPDSIGSGSSATFNFPRMPLLQDPCLAKNLQVNITIQTQNSNNAGGRLSEIKFFYGNTAVTDNFAITKQFGKNQQNSTGWKTVPMKMNCDTDIVDKIKIKCSDSIQFEWLKIDYKSNNITRTKTFWYGTMNPNTFYEFSIPALPTLPPLPQFS